MSAIVARILGRMLPVAGKRGLRPRRRAALLGSALSPARRHRCVGAGVTGAIAATAPPTADTFCERRLGRPGPCSGSCDA